MKTFRLLLPVRFLELWDEDDYEESEFPPPLPPVLWEALYAALWRAIKRRDPKWAKRFAAALIQTVLVPSAANYHEPELLKHLARLEISKDKGGRPKGRGISSHAVLFLYPRLIKILAPYYSRRFGYLPTPAAVERQSEQDVERHRRFEAEVRRRRRTIARLRARGQSLPGAEAVAKDPIKTLVLRLESAWDQWADSDFLPRPVAFPRVEIEKQLQEPRPPSEIAIELLAHASGLGHSSVATYITHAKAAKKRAQIASAKRKPAPL